MAQIAKKQILRLPRGMVSSVPPENVEAGRLTYLENYEFSEGAHRVRRGFVKKNRWAIPSSGMVFNGVDQWLSVPIPDAGQNPGGYNPFAQGSITNQVISADFMIDQIPLGAVNGDEWFIWYYGGTGVDEATWALSVRALTDGSKGLKLAPTLRVLGTVVSWDGGGEASAEGDLRPGVGYRMMAFKDTAIGTQHWRLLVFREDTPIPINGVNGTTGNLSGSNISTHQMSIGRSLSTASPGYFPGTIQNLHYWRYDDGGVGSTTMRTFWGAAPFKTESRALATYDRLLSQRERNDLFLRFYAKLDQSNNEISTFKADVGYSDYNIIKQPSRCGWLVPGLVDNAPKTACLDMRPDPQHFFQAKDIPGSNSLFDQIRKNTFYEMAVSVAFRIDSVTVKQTESLNLEQLYMPIFYAGDASGDGKGVDVGLAGEWVCYIALVNVSVTPGAPDYRVEFGFVSEDDVRVARGPTLNTIEYDKKYRVDLIRDGRYALLRVYAEDEQFQSSDTEMYKVDLGVDFEDKLLFDSDFSNAFVFNFGTLFYSSVQSYFPGQIDDPRVYSRNPEKLPDEYNIARHVWDKVKPDTSCIFYALLNEGQGFYAADASSYDNSFSATNADRVPDHHELLPVVAHPSHGPGWVKGLEDMPVAGLTSYKDSISQTEQIMAVVGGSIWATSVGEVSPDQNRRFTTIATGLTGSKPMSFAHLNNSVIFADGVNPNLRWDGKSMSSLGIPAPTSAPLVAAIDSDPSGSFAAGTYVVYYSWKNSKTGERGNLSPGASITLDQSGPPNENAISVGYGLPDYDAFPLETAGIDTVQIWRTKVGGVLPYLEREVQLPTRDGGQVPTTGSYQGPSGAIVAPERLTAGDASLGLTTVSNLADASFPPQAKFVCNARGRLFLAGIPGRPNRLAWSMLNYPGMHDPLKQWSDDIDQGNGDEITGLVFEGGSLYIFMRRSIWIMRGIEDEAQMRLDLLYHGIGCVDQSTIQVVSGTIMFRGEDNFYALNPGQANPLPVGDDIRNLLEWVSVDLDEFGTSAVLPKEGIYLCALTSKIAQTIGEKNDFIFAFDTKTGSWGLWSLPQLGYFANIELGERSQLYALMRTSFVMKYDNLGLPEEISYADGLRVDKRAIFTLKSNVEFGGNAGFDYIDVVEDDATVDIDQDSMAGCYVSWITLVNKPSARRVIRKAVPIEGGGVRFYLDLGTTTVDLASAGIEAFVGGYDKRMVTPMLTADPNEDWSSQARVLQLSILGEGCGSIELPLYAPKLISGSAGIDIYAYTYKSDTGESARSPRLDGASRTDAKLELIAPSTDIGPNPKIRVYRLAAFQSPGDKFELVAEIDVVGRPGAEIVFSDLNLPKTDAYDPNVECSKLQISAECIYRDEPRKIDSEQYDRILGLDGPGTWRLPLNFFCSRYQLTFEIQLPRAQHTISGLMVDMDMERIDQ